MLLDAGADPDIRDDKYDASVLGWAEFFGQDQLAQLSAKRGGASERARGLRRRLPDAHASAGNPLAAERAWF